MFADKPHRLNGRIGLAHGDLAIFGFDDLASGYGTHGWATRAAGYRVAISCTGAKRPCEARILLAVIDLGGIRDRWRQAPSGPGGVVDVSRSSRWALPRLSELPWRTEGSMPSCLPLRRGRSQKRKVTGKSSSSPTGTVCRCSRQLRFREPTERSECYGIQVRIRVVGA
jgi:hypothetical protein